MEKTRIATQYFQWYYSINTTIINKLLQITNGSIKKVDKKRKLQKGKQMVKKMGNLVDIVRMKNQLKK